jgi:hypothetical protein
MTISQEGRKFSGDGCGDFLGDDAATFSANGVASFFLKNA